MKSVRVISRVENGKCRKNTKLINSAFATFEGKEIEITIKRKYVQRSNPQNSFYWGVTISFFQNLFLEEWGEIKTAEETHEILKSVCNFKEIVNKNTGQIINIPQSTTELTTFGFMEYQQKLKQFARDFFNCETPEPNEQLILNI